MQSPRVLNVQQLIPFYCHCSLPRRARTVHEGRDVAHGILVLVALRDKCLDVALNRRSAVRRSGRGEGRAVNRTDRPFRRERAVRKERARVDDSARRSKSKRGVLQIEC